MVSGIRRFLGCNHVRSYEFFIESIRTECPFLSVPCSSWDRFQQGGCFDCVNQYCPRFGLDAHPGNYHASTYLMTGSSRPFCSKITYSTVLLHHKIAIIIHMLLTPEMVYIYSGGHYRVTINTSRTAESMSHGGDVGVFVLRVIGTDGRRTERMQFSESSRYYEPGSTHTIVLPGEVVGKPSAVEVTWEYQTTLNPLTWRLITNPRVYIDSVVVDSLEASHG